MGNIVSGEEKKLRRHSHSKRLKRQRFDSISTFQSGSHKEEDYVNKPYSLNTDSQMTLLSHSPTHKSLAGILYDNNQSISTIHTTTTTTTTTATTNTTALFSAELLLKELYLSSETSPERRRDRDRRHRQHYLLKRIWKSNYKIPLHNPTLIIDWCCATAVWDIELAFEFPNAKIIGIDYESVTVSSLTNTVKNFSFQNANLHEGDIGLHRFQDNTVDYIMMRDVWLVNSSPAKWKNVLKQVYRVLKPGGYIEIYEQDMKICSLGPSFTLLEQWSTTFFEAIQYDISIMNKLDTYLQEMKFIHVKKECVNLPIGEWSTTQELKETGYLQRDMIERTYRESKRWLCSCNHISDKQFTNTLLSAMEECDDYKTNTHTFYYAGQKPPL